MQATTRELSRYLQSNPAKPTLCSHRVVAPHFEGKHIQDCFCVRCGDRVGPNENRIRSVRRYIAPNFGNRSLTEPVTEIDGLTTRQAAKLWLAGFKQMQDILHCLPNKNGEYPVSNAIPQTIMNKLVNYVFSNYPIEDPLSPSDLIQLGLVDLREAFLVMHGLSNKYSKESALARINFDSLMRAQWRLLRDTKDREKMAARPLRRGDRTNSFLATIPYELTASQKKIIKHAHRECSLGVSKEFLIQGDVGSGKTLIACLLIAQMVDSGGQCAVLAPTAILAGQLFEEVRKIPGVRCEMLVSATGKIQRNDIRKGLRDGSIDVVIGTSSICTEAVAFKSLGLVVIDEQHKFGVELRKSLIEKGNAHVFMMSATPIPRSLALSTYGGDILLNDSLPKGRKPTITKLAASYAEAIALTKESLGNGDQFYVVAPLKEGSDESDLHAAEDIFEQLRDSIGHDNVCLIHGKTPKYEQKELFRRFNAGEIRAIVATTVISVGINNPNANTILILNAGQFGLAELHQLRGRVGRGKIRGTCVLHSESKTQKTIDRLNVLCASNDGFFIAEKDLEARGPGEQYGTKQSGMFKLTAMSFENPQLLEAARMFASRLMQATAQTS